MPNPVQSFTLVDVPGGVPLLGHLRAFKGRPLETMSAWWRRHGDALRFRLGPKTLYLFSHPELAEEILVQQSDRFVKVYDPRRPVGLALVLGNGLVTSSGEVWKRHRRIIQPVFHRSRMAAMADRMAQVGEQRLAGWADHAGQPVDIAAEMMQLALEVIAQTMFTTSVAHHIDQINHALRVSLKYAFDSFHNPLRPPLWVPTARNREFRAVMQFMDGLIYGLIAERRRSGAKHDDLLDLLLQARDEETGAGLSDLELRDEALTIFAAGHETTANALAWTWYLLATHPEAKARFHEEVDRVLQGRTPNADDLQHLPYTRAVFDEALRLYPPAPAVQRKAATRATVGGLSLPAGAIVLVGAYNIHRHPAYWRDPERFMPERWLDGERPAARCAYLPFGAGPRACVGTHFATVEGPLLLALIGRRYDLRLAQESVEPELIVTLRPKGGIRMVLQPRHAPEMTGT
ncbi:cytochrome P450 [Nitrospira sp. NS4]|uniref:cytochrome P450 n=1 Tax=Nitrospira sp. NS4 TaxID=3414498 RepID=UPI003C2DF0E4